MKATDAHISMIGHVTKTELLRRLTETEAANGFANRFLWLLVRRSKELPFGGEWFEVDKAPLIGRLSSALEFGRSPIEITWGESARAGWVEVYGPLSKGKPGMFGAVTGRSEAQAMRLAALYAVLDESDKIEVQHLEAALALWQYAEDSARHVFGDATGDALADAIVLALRAAGTKGVTRTQVRDHFGRNVKADRINKALAMLSKASRVYSTTEGTGGRPTERWFLRWPHRLQQVVVARVGRFLYLQEGEKFAKFLLGVGTEPIVVE